MRAKKVTRRSTRKKASSGAGAWLWLLGGILIGLGFAVVLALQGYLPELQQHLPSIDEDAPTGADSELVKKEVSKPDTPKKPRYDFFTVLPEMEVVVPEQELSRKAGPDEVSLDSYILQVGSFQSESDAEQMKAQLALLGSVATVQTVTVNGKTWHRVRIGPFKGARKADEIRRLLLDNKIDTLVMKVSP